MTPTDPSDTLPRATTRARWLNLLVPGAGLILTGNVAGGLAIGLSFAVAATLAVIASLIIPADFSPRGRILIIVVAAVAYIAAQFLLERSIRSNAHRDAEARRKQHLGQAAARFQAGDIDGAWAALQPLASRLDHDLLIAVRWAQVLERLGDAGEIASAWERVRALDRHRIYGREVQDALRRIGMGEPSVDAGAARTRRGD